MQRQRNSLPVQNMSRKKRAWSKYLDLRRDHWVAWRTCTRHSDNGRQLLFTEGSIALEMHPKLVAQQPQQVCHPEFICRKSSCLCLQLSKTVCGIFVILQREDNEQTLECKVVFWRKLCTPKPEVSPTNWLWHGWRQRCFYTREGYTMTKDATH